MLTQIDDLIRPDHYRLTAEDECYFIGEYTAGQGYSHSATNQMILNLKKGVDRRSRPEYYWKERAIHQAATVLRGSVNPPFLQSATFVPVPPSRAADDPLYDDRMTQVLRLLGGGVDVRVLVRQLESTEGAHNSPDRPGPHQLYENYTIDESLAEPVPVQIAVVDDVLTTGAHFKALKRILHERFPEAPIVGLFLARRVPDTE
jgi:hypothetical protein